MITAVTNIPKINIYSSYNSHTYAVRTSYKQDCVSFSSKNLLTLPSEEISKIVTKAIEQENFLGSGRFGEVYKIPDTDYCVKILKKNWMNKTNFGKWSTEIDEADKANHILAKAENDSTIMKYVKGTSLFKYTETENLAELPETTFRQFLKQISDAEQLGLAFDNAPANVIYDAEKKTLTAIDFYRPNFEFEIYPFTQVFSALESRNVGYQSLISNKKLAGKIMNIALDEYAKKGPTEFKFEDGDIMRLMHRVGSTYKVNLPPQYKFLKQSFLDIMELKKAQRRGEDADNELAGKIKYAKAIIKQILTDI